jgi:AcrR family transcriptional regulator
MPRAFSEQEREAIRARLLERGRALFAGQGLRKTSVEELAAAVGISKGAFYLFFTSKEELFFTLLEEYEAGVKTALLEQIARADLAPRAQMRAMLTAALAAWKAGALFTRFSRAEYELLLGRLAPARVAAHIQGDEAFAEEFAAAWAARGAPLAEPPHLVAGLLRALFFISMHEDDFGDAIYPAVITTMVEMLAARLIPAEEHDDDRGA